MQPEKGSHSFGAHAAGEFPCPAHWHSCSILPVRPVWLTFRRRSVGRFGLLLFIVECTSGRQHYLDHWIVLGKLHSHQAGSLKFSDIHGILECELGEDLDALHEKLFAASSLPLRRLAISSTSAHPWGQSHWAEKRAHDAILACFLLRAGETRHDRPHGPTTNARHRKTLGKPCNVCQLEFQPGNNMAARTAAPSRLERASDMVTGRHLGGRHILTKRASISGSQPSNLGNVVM